MENFIYETMLDDVTVCDKLIEYHKNNTEHNHPHSHHHVSHNPWMVGH